MGNAEAEGMFQRDQRIVQVYAVGYSADHAARIGCELRAVLAEQAQVIELSTVDLDQASFDSRRFTCGAVITLQNAALCHMAYVEFLQTCIDQVCQRDDFRVYLLLEDVSDEQIRQSQSTSDDPAERVLARLMDTVQWSSDSTVVSIAQQVHAQVKTLEETRRQSQWRRVRLSTAAIASHVATVIQLLCLAPSLFLVFWLPVWDTHATLREYAGHEREVAVICGIVAVPLLMLLLFSYTRYGPFLVRMYEQRLGILYAGVGSVIGAPVMGVPVRLHAPLSWIAVGLVSGFLLDASRRHGYAVRRQRHDISLQTIARRHGRLGVRLRRQAMPTWIDPLRAPLLPLAFPHVFISYTRASQWGEQLAGDLSRRLAAAGAGVFSDHAIPEGTSWRRALNQNLGRASVLIALVDAATVVREWPAAEMEAALLGEAMAGSPRLVIIRAPGFPPPDDDAWRWLPVFRTVLAPRKDHRESGPIVLVDSDETMDNIAAALRPKSYFAQGVFPNELAELLRRLWAIPQFLVLLLGSAGVIAGYLGFVLFLLYLAGLDVAGWLTQAHLQTTLFATYCLWLGYTVRLTLASRFQLRHSRWRHITATHLNACIGLAAMVAILSLGASPLAITCGSLIGVISFCVAHGYCEDRARHEPAFLLASD